MSGAMYRWRAPGGLVPCEWQDGPLLVADSWLVDAGAVQGLERHYRRFAASCADLQPGTVGLREFWAAACRALPRSGRWFPRVELAGDPGAGDPGAPRLSLRVRPAPATSATARLWIHGGGDPRRFPGHKGPDLAALGELRRRAHHEGADDALLTTADGILLEAAHASVLWWEAGTLCVPAAGLPVLPGVTAGLIRDRASALGVPIKDVRRRPQDLDSCEVWLVNSLHGIRSVTALAGCAAQPAPATRAPDWQGWLQSIAVPVTDPAAGPARRHLPASRG
jgi:branched-subunit amino acid aminotransferase/4-amino-4-deoxychorismate lyase